MLTIYKGINSHSSGGDGMGGWSSSAYFTTLELAERYVKGGSDWGRDGRIETITVYDPQDDYFKDEKAKLIEQARKKLTPEEIKALGLDK